MLATSSSDRTDTAARGVLTGDGTIPARILGLTPHDPILIDGNAGFTGPNVTTGVVRGSGTESDPYIIEGLDINASAANGIEIQNADAHFIVRGCLVHDGRAPYDHFYDGIHLENCVNGTLDNNTWPNNGIGIYLTSSSCTTLTENNCANNWNGMILDSSSNNTLADNECSNNVNYGMSLESSNGNTLTDNECSNNEYGVYLQYSSGNTISNNNCSNNGQGIYVRYDTNNNTITSNDCSSNGEYGIFLLYSSGNALVNNTCNSNSRSGTCLWLSNGNILINNTCSSNGYGIWLDWSSSNTVSNNNCSNNEWGIYLGYGANDNNIVWNQIRNNYGSGALISRGAIENIVSNNIFIDNNGATDTYDAAHIQAFDEGLGNWWNSTDGYGNYYSDWTSPDSNSDGIVDDPYLLDGGADAKDPFPLATTPSEPIPEFGMMPFVVMVFLAAIAATIGARRRKA